MNPIVEKVRKLLNLANDSSASEGERDNALRMAHAFLAKHNLTMSTVEASGAEPTEERLRQDSEFYGRPWARTVAKAVGELFFCEYFISTSYKKNMVYHCFVGKESNVITSLEMSKYLVDSIRKEASRRQREMGETVSWRRSFATGAAARIRARVADIKKASQFQIEPSSCTGLILASVYTMESAANQSFIQSSGTKLTLINSTTKPAGSGFSEGHEFGGKLSLNRQLGGSSQARIK